MAREGWGWFFDIERRAEMGENADMSINIIVETFYTD
jgi:hypothetical protein